MIRDFLARIVLACTAVIVVLIGLLDWRKSKKLDRLQDDIQKGHASIHNRFDQSDQRTEHLHNKFDRLRTSFKELWLARIEAFTRRWRK